MMNELSKEHIKTYNALAEEYESRVNSLIPVTQNAVNKLSEYLERGKTVLELGCGVGLAAKLLTEKGFKVTCVELSPEMIIYAKKRVPNVNFICGDFLNLDFDKKFDAIFGFAFIHLFPRAEAERVLKKAHSLLKERGLLYIGTTESEKSSEGWEIKKDYGKKHKRFRKHWTEEEFRDFLESANFEIVGSIKKTDPFGKKWVDVVAKKV